MKSLLTLIIMVSLMSILSPGPLNVIPDEQHLCVKIIKEAIRTKQRDSTAYAMMSNAWQKPVKNFTDDYKIIKYQRSIGAWYFWVEFSNGFKYLFEMFPCGNKWYLLVHSPEEEAADKHDLF